MPQVPQFSWSVVVSVQAPPHTLLVPLPPAPGPVPQLIWQTPARQAAPDPPLGVGQTFPQSAQLALSVLVLVQ